MSSSIESPEIFEVVSGYLDHRDLVRYISLTKEMYRAYKDDPWVQARNEEQIKKAYLLGNPFEIIPCLLGGIDPGIEYDPVSDTLIVSGSSHLKKFSLTTSTRATIDRIGWDHCQVVFRFQDPNQTRKRRALHAKGVMNKFLLS